MDDNPYSNELQRDTADVRPDSQWPICYTSSPFFRQRSRGFAREVGAECCDTQNLDASPIQVVHKAANRSRWIRWITRPSSPVGEITPLDCSCPRSVGPRFEPGPGRYEALALITTCNEMQRDTADVRRVLNGLYAIPILKQVLCIHTTWVMNQPGAINS